MTIFYSVDVETANTVVTPNALLSVGIQVVLPDLSMGPMLYLTVSHPHIQWDEGTLDFWMQQDREVYAACRENPRTPFEVAGEILGFVDDCQHEDDTYGRAVFVANPVAFDKPWIDNLFYTTGLPNPFDYRSLCIRSMHFGFESDIEWGTDREKWGRFNIEPAIKHHALHDAIAQAHEFVALMKARQGVASA